MTVMAGVAAALKALEILMPIYEGLVAKGKVPVEQQAKDRAAFDALRSRAAFSGEAWKKSGRVQAGAKKRGKA
jgi:hypothetical protein